MDQKSRVLFHFAPYLPPDSNAAVLRNASFRDALEEAGVAVRSITLRDLFCRSPRNTDHPLIRMATEFFCGIELALRFLLAPRGAFFLFSSPPYFISLYGTFAAWIRCAPFAWDVRDLYPQVFVDSGLLSERSIFFRIFDRLTEKIYRRARFVLCATEGIQEKISNQVEEKTKVLHLPNGFDENLFKASKEKLPQFTVVFLGTLGRFQKAELLPDIAREMERRGHSWKLLVLGSGPKQNLLADAPSNLEFRGQLPHEEIAKILPRCHAALRLGTEDFSSAQGMPVRVFEYFATELPVVSTPPNNPCSDWIHNVWGLACNNNALEIVDALERIERSELSFRWENREAYSRRRLAGKLISELERVKFLT